MSMILNDISHIKKEDEENENNDSEINKFSRNFNKCFQKLKNQENNNKNNNISEKMVNNNNKNNNLENSSAKDNNNIYSNVLINSLVEFDLIKNIPKVQITKYDIKQKKKKKIHQKQTILILFYQVVVEIT